MNSSTRVLVRCGLALSLGVGGYLGSAQIANPASSRSRVITLRSQDVAVFGGVQCVGNVEAGYKHMLCSRRPRSKARYDVAIFPRSVVVYRMGNPDNPLYATP
jgi:hypothetical protein